MRVVIVGNSGSGKTWLADRLADSHSSRVVHLDDIFWLPGSFDERRGPADVARHIDAARSADEWIAEGVYGSLAQQFLLSADTFVWLEIPWEVCRRRLEHRGSESQAHMGREQSEAGLRDLIKWAEGYSSRQGSSGHAAHLALFERFEGARHRLRSESQVMEYLNAA